MGNVSGRIVAFIASLVVGFIIVTNIKLSSLPIKKQLSATEYKEAVEERNKLFSELEMLQDENTVTREKISSYTSDDRNDEKVVSDMVSQLKDYGMLTGLSPVMGPGVVIRIKDAFNTDINNESNYKDLREVFHDMDAIMMLNDIRLAGGEVVAIDDHRIIPSTGLECGWAFIEFEDDTETVAPFDYYVIGDPEQLEIILTKEGSYINELKIRGLKVEIEVKEQIILPATGQKAEAKFMRRVENKKEK